MVNYYVYAQDCPDSSSVHGVEYYHENGLETHKHFLSAVEKSKSESPASSNSRTVYLHWDTECVQVDEGKPIRPYVSRHDAGGAKQDTIVRWIKPFIKDCDKIMLFYIIIDGSVSRYSADDCLKLLENIEIEKVIPNVCHQNDQTDIPEYDYENITNDNFAMEKENLKSYIRLKYINTTKSNAAALSEIEKLKQLRHKLFIKLSLRKEGKYCTKDKNTFVNEFTNSNWYRNLNNPSYDMKIDIEKSISSFINYIVAEKKSDAFDAWKFHTKFSNEVTEEPIADVSFTDEQEIEFPDIILADDKGVPVILFTELNLLDKIIFQTSDYSASFSKFKSMMECPLFLLKDPDMNDSIGYFYTLTAYKQLLAKSTKLEPRSRRPYHGGLVLVDNDDFDRYNDYILSATYFNCKKVKYNVGLFYFVLWKICESKQWMDANVVEHFKKYMLRRVSSTECRIGLSSLPLDPQINTSLPTALWYCVEMSTHIFKNDPQHFAHERLRMYSGAAHSMIEILQYLQYDLDMDSINKRVDLIRHVMTLKKISTKREKLYYLAERIFKKVNGFLVCVIENQSNVQKLNYLKLNHKEMLSDDIINEEVNLNDYIFFLHDGDDSRVQICKETYRPFFMIDQNTSFYSEMFKKAQKVVLSDIAGEIVTKYEPIDQIEFNKMLSHYSLYLRFVKDCEKFPSLEEYVDYVLKKKKYKDNLVTIFPVTVYNKIKKGFEDYESLRKDVDIKEFIRIFNKYVSRVERIKAENGRTFESDYEINEYILNEEFKFNLKKVKNLPKKKASINTLSKKLHNS